MNKLIYYVYGLIDPDTLLPFYIGKGKNKRAESHIKLDKRDIYNQRKRCKIEQLLAEGKQIDIIFYFKELSSNNASDEEVRLIKKYGRLGFEQYGILLNLTLGGEGGDTSMCFTDESRKKISDRHSGVNNPQTTLTKQQVLEIYYSCDSLLLLSKKYKISTGQISSIKRKISFKKETAPITDFPGFCTSGRMITVPMPVDVIPKIYCEEGDYSYFKEKYHASRQVVINIKTRKTYKKLTEHLGPAGKIKRYGLTDNDAVDIYESPLSLLELSKKYNVHIETVRNIKNVSTRKFFNEI